MTPQLLTTYLVLINAAAFVLMLADKLKARKGAWRIPESTLMGMAFLGGSVGAIAGMYAFRHKTRHKKFTVGLRLILAAQAAVILLIIR